MQCKICIYFLKKDERMYKMYIIMFTAKLRKKKLQNYKGKLKILYI